MDTRCAGRRGGIARKQRLSAERLREIAKTAADASVAKRRGKRAAIRAIADLFQSQDSELAQVSHADVEKLVVHGMEFTGHLVRMNLSTELTAWLGLWPMTQLLERAGSAA